MRNQKNPSFFFRQALHGESAGLPVLRNLIKKLESKNLPDRLLDLMKSQWNDERRHVEVYRKLLESTSNEENLEVTQYWKNIFHRLGNELDCLPVCVVGIYGLVEPYNHMAVSQFMLPTLNGEKLAAVKQILVEEENHIMMLDLYEEYFAGSITDNDRQKIHSFIHFFLSELRNGTHESDGSPINLSNQEKWEFIRNVTATRRRVLSW